MFRLATGFAVGAALITAQQPDERDQAWIHAPEHVAEEIKNRLGGRRHRTSLLTKRGTEDFSATKIQHDLGRAESALEVALQGQPVLLRKEDDLLRKASQMAHEAGEAKASHIRLAISEGIAADAPSHSAEGTVKSAHAKADKKPLVGVQKAEAALIGQGFGIIREAKDIKGEVVDAIGESDPQMAAKVEHLMDKLQKDQSGIMSGEQKLANGIGQILHDTQKATPAHKKKAALAQHAVQTIAFESMESLASEERKLSHNELQTLSSVELVRHEVEQALSKSPEAASKVASLLKSVQTAQQSIVHIDEAAVARDHEVAAHGFSGPSTPQHENGALVRTDVSSDEANLARSEEKLSQEDAITLDAAEQVKKTAVNELKNHPSAAAKIASLMSTFETDQEKIVKIDRFALAHDNRHHNHWHQDRSALAQQHLSMISGENAAVFSKLQLRKQELRTAVVKREHLAKETRRILAETDRAQAAVEEELGGTNAGSQVADILQKAEVFERNVAKGARHQVNLAQNDMLTEQKLADIFVQHSSSGTPHTDANFPSKLKQTEHDFRSLSVRRDGLVKQSRHLLAETDRAQAAIEEEFGGTDLAAQVASMLQKAQAAERIAAHDSTVQAALAKKEVQSISNLEKELGHTERK